MVSGMSLASVFGSDVFMTFMNAIHWIDAYLALRLQQDRALQYTQRESVAEEA